MSPRRIQESCSPNAEGTAAAETYLPEDTTT